MAGFAQAASDLIHERFRYVKGATHVHSSIEDSLSIGAGVCQDFAHVLLGVVRMRGIPGRYVSGYLVPGSDTGPDARQEEVIGGQASHAWAEVLIPENGWMGLDPTLGNPVGCGTCAWRMDETTATWRRCAAFTKGMPGNISPWTCAFARPLTMRGASRSAR